MSQKVLLAAAVLALILNQTDAKKKHFGAVVFYEENDIKATPSVSRFKKAPKKLTNHITTGLKTKKFSASKTPTSITFDEENVNNSLFNEEKMPNPLTMIAELLQLPITHPED